METESSIKDPMQQVIPIVQNEANKKVDINDLHPEEGSDAVNEDTVIPEPLPLQENSATAVITIPQANAANNGGMFPNDELWLERVDGQTLVMELTETFGKFSILPTGSPLTAALWSILTYSYDIWQTLPILAIVSPEKRCGKTKFLTTLKNLCNQPLSASNISTGALYRAIESYAPTLLLDEVDTFLQGKRDLHGIINSGHTKETAYVIRCEGKDHTPVRFSTWCPKAIAMIGLPPGTIKDRSILVNLRRKLPEEVTETHGEEHVEEFRRLKSMIIRFVEDNAEALKSARPARLNTLNDRQADNWHPLLAIAQVAGCEVEAREAALLSVGEDREDPSDKIELLLDIREIFKASRLERISTSELIRKLVVLDDRPWVEWKQGKPLTPTTMARLLNPFGISPKTIRFSKDSIAKGYQREDFRDAFARYLPPSVTHVTDQN